MNCLLNFMGHVDLYEFSRYLNYCIKVMIYANRMKFQHETHIDILEILVNILCKNLYKCVIPLRIQKN